MNVPILEKLLNRTYRREPEITAGEADWDTLDRLEEKKFLIPTGILEGMSCSKCHRLCSVGWSNIKGRGNIPFASCVECGIYEVHPKRLRRWNVRLETILERLVEKLELRGGIQVHVPNLLWRLGRKRNREYLYVRRYDPEERRMFRNELSKMPNAILITGTKRILEDVRFDHDHTSFSLVGVTSLDEQCEMLIDFEVLQDIIGKEDSVKKKPVTVASKRGSRTAKMERLVHEIEEHLRAAREHARVTAEQGRIELLPRPSLGELAKRTGLSKMDVSRCLKDTDAHVLKYLWNQADDLKSILK